jgi:hypothetical protein
MIASLDKYQTGGRFSSKTFAASARTFSFEVAARPIRIGRHQA